MKRKQLEEMHSDGVREYTNFDARKIKEEIERAERERLCEIEEDIEEDCNENN